MQDISGIYVIRNRENGKCYIGSTYQMSRRWIRHRYHLRHGTHHSPHLQAAWHKHGEEVFEFSVLEECAADVRLEREQFYLDTMKPEYNMSDMAVAARPEGTKMPPEFGAKISASKTGKSPSATWTRTHSQETRDKTSRTLKGRTLSQQTKDRMSAARKGKPHKPTCQHCVDLRTPRESIT